MEGLLKRIKSFRTQRHDPVSTPESAEPAEPKQPVKDRFFRWIKHFTLYLGAVVAACATAIFFLWQIPFLQDFPELVKSVSDPRTARPSSTTVSPLGLSGIQATSPQTPALDQLPAPTGTINVATTQPATDSPSDPTAPPTAPEQTAVPLASPADVPAPLAETSAEDTAAPPTPQAEIEQLLADARQQMENRRFISPASGNALRSYQRVLELEPENSAALDGIQRIAGYYQNIAQQSLSQGRTDEGLAYINRGLRAAPNNSALLSLRKEARLAKQREEQQRQAFLREERQRQETESMRELYRQPPPQQQQRPQQPWWQRQQQQPSFNESWFNQR